MTALLTNNPNDIKAAASIIRSGGLVALPTETVYGLGANALDIGAVKKIYAAKGRPSDNPLIVHVAEISDIDAIVSTVPETAKKLAAAFWPGALTIILPSNGTIPSIATGGLASVAVRVPANEIMRAVIREAGVPIAAPSANSSGKPSPTLAKHVLEDLDGKIDAVLDGGAAALGLESTVIDLTGTPCLLRPGMVTLEMLEEVIGEVHVGAVTVEGNAPPKSPGMKYRHYAPRAKVILFKPNPAEIHRINAAATDDTGIFATNETARHFTNGRIIQGGKTANDVAANLFKALRELDCMGVSTIYAEAIDECGAGAAVMNRLKKAAVGDGVLDVLPSNN